MPILTAAISVGERPWVLTRLELLLDNLWIEAHLLKEAVNHMFPAVTFTSMTVTVMLSVVSLGISVSWLSFFIENGNHNSGRTTCFLNLKEGMIVVKFFFAVRTVVEVLADSALVTDSKDRRLTATIARNTNMNYWLLTDWLLGLLSFRNLEANTFVFQ